MTLRVIKVDTSHDGVSAAILAMDAKCFPGDERMGLHGDWWIVYDGKKPVGYAGMWQSVRAQATGYLCRAGVLPEARGKGLQKRLARAREKEAKRKGWVAIITDTHPRNVQSINNLIACGFRAYKPSADWSFDHFCYWRKIIEHGVA